MQYSVTFRHMDPSEHLKEYGHEKLLKLEKYLDSILDADIIFTVEKFRHKAEVLITSDGLKIKAEEETEDMYSALDLVIDKLEKQIKRHREKLKGHNKGITPRKGTEDTDYNQPIEERDEITADRIRDLPLNKMNLDEAAFKLAQSSTPFVAFIDRDEGGLRLLYQSSGGALELIRLHQN